jgi:hypothetical protein
MGRRIFIWEFYLKEARQQWAMGLEWLQTQQSSEPLRGARQKSNSLKGFEMEYEQFIKENSMEYRGYTIGPGTVRKEGEVIIMFYAPLDACKEEIFKVGKAAVDDLLAKDGNASTTATRRPA